MGTKNNPGTYDCYANAEPDEPMFVLLGRDPLAEGLIKLWALLRHRAGEDAAKITEALACAEACRAWAAGRGKPRVDFDPFLTMATEDMGEHPDGYDDVCDCDVCKQSYDH